MRFRTHTIAVLFPLLVVAVGGSLTAQDTLSGKVMDQVTLEPLRNASIVDTTTGEGTASDATGYFTIPRGKAFIVTLVGYEDRVIQVDGGQVFVRVLLRAVPYDLEEVVVSGVPSGPVTQLRTAAPVSMMDRRDLERDNGSIIVPALNRTPGIFMHSGTFNTNRLTIRGIGARSPYATNKVRAYFREIPLTNGSGETTIEDVDLDFIDRVEVIKGPSSSLYGSGLGGTVLLYPGHPGQGPFQLQQRNTIGAYGLFRNTTALSAAGDKGDVALSYNRTHSDGYRENNRYDRHSMFLYANLFAGPRHTISLLTLYARVKAFIPSSVDSATFADDPRAAAPSWAETQGYEDYDRLLAGISHEFDISENMEWNTALFGSRRMNDELRPFNILKEESRDLGLRSTLRHVARPLGVRTTVAVGGEFYAEEYAWSTYENQERAAGDILSDNEETRTYLNLFVQLALEVTDRISLHAGLNVNTTDYNYRDLYVRNGDLSGDHGFDPVWSPRFAVSYAFGGQQFLYAHASHGFSPPSLEETLTPEGAVNPGIRPETGWNFELGLRGKLLGEALYYDAAVYSMLITDLLVAERVGEDQYMGLNAGSAAHRGAEILLRYAMIRKESVQVRLFANATFADNRFTEFVNDGTDHSGNRIPGTPASMLNLGMDVTSRTGFYGNVNYQHVGEMALRDDNSLYYGPYGLLNLKMGFGRTLFGRLHADVHAGILNLLDVHYASMVLVNAVSFGGSAPRYYYPGLPRNWFAGLALAYLF